MIRAIAAATLAAGVWWWISSWRAYNAAERRMDAAMDSRDQSHTVTY